MGGFVHVLCHCFTCRQEIMVNPSLCPSLPAAVTGTGTKEPVCRTCIEIANPKRIAAGLDPILIHPDAYNPEPC